MKVLGITGGVGSGKSEVLHYMEKRYCAVVCELDEVAKMLQKRDGNCFVPITTAFGSEILNDDGELDRQKLAAIIFADKAKRKIMNEIVHPEVKRWVEQDIEQKKQMGVPLYIIEAALLPDAGYTDVCEEMWYIYTDDHTRRERLKKSRGYTDEKIRHIFESQLSEEAFRKACQVVIDNSRTFEDTKRQIGENI